MMISTLDIGWDGFWSGPWGLWGPGGQQRPARPQGDLFAELAGLAGFFA
ncbi:MAG: hypothetical protein HC884_17440, partial [Chloroflexaceae bacterium]|nr:hypothetical protein [Chloroflexaceae bacterium]